MAAALPLQKVNVVNKDASNLFLAHRLNLIEQVMLTDPNFAIMLICIRKPHKPAVCPPAPNVSKKNENRFHYGGRGPRHAIRLRLRA